MPTKVCGDGTPLLSIGGSVADSARAAATAPKTERVQQFHFDTGDPLYEALPDKNGEIWAGALHAGRIVRFNPRTERWTEYMMPEPCSHNRRTWIDNSTTPVIVWYVDHNGYVVRIQPIE